MSAAPAPYSNAGRGKLPIPGWVKMPLIGIGLLGTVSALTWFFVVPHKASEPAIPRVDWSPITNALKLPKETVETPEPAPDKKTDKTSDLPGPVANAAPTFHRMQVWGAEGSNTPPAVDRTTAPRRAGYGSEGPPGAPHDERQGGGNSEYGNLLTSTKTHETEAGVYQDYSLLLPESKSAECLPDGPLDNQLPGGFSCTISEDIYSADGTNILINRFATASGEVVRGVGLGQNRAFILWKKIRSNKVYAQIDSPATDLLGQMGVPGILDEHWWAKIKATVALTAIETAGGVAQNLASKGGNTSLNFGAGQSLASQAAQHDINIPATLWRGQAWPIRIYFQHDVQFHRAYNNVLVAGVK